MSRPPSYLSRHNRARDRKPSLRESSWAVCGLRTEFFEKRHFLEVWILFKLQVFEEHSPFDEIKPHMHMLRVSQRSQTLTAIPPCQVSALTIEALRYWDHCCNNNTCMCIHNMRVYTYMYLYTYTYIHTCTYTHIHIYRDECCRDYVCMCIHGMCVYTYMYVYTYT